MPEDKKIKCPACGSEEISKPEISKQAFAITILLFGFPLPFLSKVFHCFDCGHNFKKKDVFVEKETVITED